MLLALLCLLLLWNVDVDVYVVEMSWVIESLDVRIWCLSLVTFLVSISL